MKSLNTLIVIGAMFLSTSLFGQAPLTDEEVMGAINRALTSKRHQIGLSLNDKQTFFLSGLVCKTCQTSGYTIFVYTPESWIELKAVQARREMLPFGMADVTPEMRLPYIHVLALPSTADYLDANGMGMASSVHRVVLSSTDHAEVIQPLSESQSTVESNSALRSFTQTSAGAVFSLEDVERLRSKDARREFFVVVVGDNQNKYFKVKTRFFNQLFGKDTEQEYAYAVPAPPEHESTATPTYADARTEAASPGPTATDPVAKPLAENAPPAPSSDPSGLSISYTPGNSPASYGPQNQPLLFGFTARNWERGGAEIVKIVPDSAAEVAGFHVGDVIRSVDGKKVRSVQDLEAALANRESRLTIRVTCFFHSNLGWMPGVEKVLSVEESR